MKFFHISDLHIGKRLNEYSLLEDQEHILMKILALADEEKPDAVLVAGDVYDKSTPSADAVTLFDRFLTGLAQRKIPVLVVSGNHDSPERIAFGEQVMAVGGVYLSKPYKGEVKCVTLQDRWGPVRFYLLPFLKPAMVRPYTERTVDSYTDALAAAIENMQIDPGVRNVLVAHQFVTNASRSDSEEIAVGGLDNVDAAVFAPFAYTALGHLHRPQNCGGERVRYCGTPLKYSFSEMNDEKSVTVVELGEESAITVRTLPLIPLRDLREIRGTLRELLSPAFANGPYKNDYLRIVLTDEDEAPGAVSRLRQIYQNEMMIVSDNERTRKNNAVAADAQAEKKSPLELFSGLFELQHNRAPDEEETAYLTELIEKAQEQD